jgi:hypothetical protein
LSRLELDLLFLGDFAEFHQHFVTDILYMPAALLGVNAIHKGNVPVFRQLLFVRVQVTRQHDTNLPARSTVLVGEARHAIAQEELDELLKGVSAHRCTVPADLDILSDQRCKLHDAVMEACDHVLRDSGFREGAQLCVYRLPVPG